MIHFQSYVLSAPIQQIVERYLCGEVSKVSQVCASMRFKCASMQVLHALVQTASLVVLIKEIGLLSFPSEPVIHCRVLWTASFGRVVSAKAF